MTDEKISDDAVTMLTALAVSGKVSEGELSQLLGWDHARVVRALEELEARGFAEPANSELN